MTWKSTNYFECGIFLSVFSSSFASRKETLIYSEADISNIESAQVPA